MINASIVVEANNLMIWGKREKGRHLNTCKQKVILVWYFDEGLKLEGKNVKMFEDDDKEADGNVS